MANSSFTVRQSRLPESAQEYLSVLRAITDLIAKGPGAFAGIRYHSAGAGERRLACRYPIRTELEYRLMARGEIIETGRGRSINTSSSGILFESERALPPQMIIQVSLDWPGRPSAAVTVDLHVAGRTVRGQGNYTAVAIERHEFRIAREARIRDRR